MTAHSKWMQWPLADCGMLLTGGTPSRSESSFWHGDVPWISAKSLKQFDIVDSEERLTDAGARASTVVPPGSILFVVRGMSLANEFRVGVTGRQVAFNQDLRALIPTDQIDGRYLARYLQAASQEILGLVDEASHGTKRLTSDRFEDIEVPLPSLDEQRRIAEILDKADALRAKRRAALAQLGTLTQSIFLDMFGDPVTNPKGWPRNSLNVLGTVERGVSKHRPRNAPELLGGPYPFVQTGDVANSDGYIRSHSATYSEAGLRQSKLWRAGTLCITIAANIAKTGILTFDACFPDSVVGFRAAESATVEFVRVWLSFLQASLEASAPESAQKNINLEILRSLKVPTPEVGQQREFAKRIASVARCKDQHLSAIAMGEEVFASLQSRAFRGEL